MIQRVIMSTIARHRQTLLFILSVLITSYVMVTLTMIYSGQLRLQTESISPDRRVHSYRMHQLKQINQKESRVVPPAASSNTKHYNRVEPHETAPIVLDSDMNEANPHVVSDSSTNDSNLHRRRQDHFVYVKIEKTGSSTFSNIFASYGYRHRLNMMFSKDPRSYLNSSEMTVGVTWDIGPDREHPHIMEQHARYNKKFYDKFFPPNTTYITSIRDPVKWFISFVDFMKIYKLYNPRQVLEEDQLFNLVRERSPIQMQQYVHNNFLQFLGFDVYKSENLTAVREYIHFIDRQFKLVMLTDYFDESLVLLKRLMNWSMADIFYTYANEAQEKSGTILTAAEQEKLLDSKHNLGDRMLYKHFNITFWKKISLQSDFFGEVDLFRRLKRKVQEFCFSNELMANRSLVLEISTTEEQIEFGDRDCLAIRVRDGKALEFSAALDEYCPFRGTLVKRRLLSPNNYKAGGQRRGFGNNQGKIGMKVHSDGRYSNHRGHKQMMHMMQARQFMGRNN